MAKDIYDSFADHNSAISDHLVKLEKSNAYKRYTTVIEKMARFIRAIAVDGTLEEGLSIIKLSQLFHIEEFADTPEELKKATASMETLETGEKHYEVLRDFPDIYRDKLAPGYLKKDRLPPDRIIPKDGMHQALESHEKHVQARFSSLLAPEEKDWVGAQIVLVQAMRKQYHAMQLEAMGISEA